MMKKTIFVLLLMVVIFSTSALADNCGGIIHCRCGDYLIESQTMWYDLIDCPDDGLTLADNIILDCNSHLIDGDGSGTQYAAGVRLGGPEDIVTNCNIQDFYFGIVVIKGSYRNIITYNTVHDNSDDGILLGEGSDHNILLGNIISHNGEIGIYLSESDGNVMSGNTISNNDYGIVVSSSNNDIWNNIFVNNIFYNAYGGDSSTNWNVSNVGNYWSDFSSNPGYPNYYAIPSGPGIDWHPIWEDVWITLMPIGNTNFPALGGILEYNITGGNNENETITLDVWVDVSVPGWTHPYGPIAGPIMDFNMPSYPWQTNINRELNIPARAPAGIYTLNGYLGEYDIINPVIYAESHFNFVKEGTERDSKFKLVDSGQAPE